MPITGTLWFQGLGQPPSNQQVLASYQRFSSGTGGYAVGDILTLEGGVGVKATFRVTRIGHGVTPPTAASGYELLTRGAYSVIPTGTVHNLLGTGTGARVWKLQFIGNTIVTGKIETTGIVGYTVSLKRPPVQENEVRFTCTTDIVYFSEDGLTGDHHIKSFIIPPFTIPALE